MSSTLKTTLTLSDSNFQAKLNSACNKAKASLQQVSQSTKGLSGMLGNLSGQIGSLTGQLGNFLNSAKLLANPWVAAGAAITGAGVAFFNYNKNLEETLRKTQQFTNLSGNELNSLRNGIDATASTYGKDFNEVLSSVDGLMSQFGISGATALQIIGDGFRAGADDSGQFLENLSKYSGAFNDIGVSADELTALLAQTRNGIFSEQGMDAIQMAGKNIRTMSNSAKSSLQAIGISGDDMIQKLNSGQMTTMDAIRQISGALKKLPPQSQEVGNVLQDVFGKKGSAAGYELITALEDVSTNLDEVKLQTGADGEALDELKNATQEWNNALQSLFGVSDSGFSHLTDQLKISVMQALTKVINKFIDLYNKSTLVRAGIAAIATISRAVWATVKSILKSSVHALEGLAGILEGLITADWDMMKSSAKKAYNAIRQDAKQLGGEIGKALTAGINQSFNGHIDKVTTVEADKSEYGKTGGSGRSGGGRSGASGGKRTGSGRSGSNRSTTSSKNGPTYTAGSLSDLEAKLSDLQKKYKDGLINITPEDYQKQVQELQEKIKQKKIDLKLDFEVDPDSIKGLEERMKKLQENQNSNNVALHLDTDTYYREMADLTKQLQDKKISILTELDEDSLEAAEQRLKDLNENQVSENVYLHLDTKEYYKQSAEITKDIQDKTVSIKYELDENSLSALEDELKYLEENQISENVYLHLDAEEYKTRHKELEQQIESEKIKLGVSLNLDEADKQFETLMSDYRKKSSFEMSVGPEKINKGDYEAQLGLIQQQMDENDQLLDQLKQLQEAYEALGEAGAAGYAMVSTKIAQVSAEQQQLAEGAAKTDKLNKSQQQLVKDMNEGADAVGNFGNAFSSLGSSLESPELNVMGIIASAIAQVLQGAGTAIAESASLGPFGWIGLAATIMGIAASVISQMKSLGNFASGGIVPYGKNVSDKNIVHVNGGEAILNQTQQKRLWNILSGQESMMMSPAFAGGQVEFKIKGDTLVGVLSNYNRKKSKI